MSRTDKDMPYWVTGAWAPEHSRDCQDGVGRCTLGKLRRQHPNWKHYRDWSCHWVPEGGYRRRSPNGWILHHLYTSPERMEVRDAVRQALAEHRGSGEAVTEPPTGQHRHSALWDWN